MGSFAATTCIGSLTAKDSSASWDFLSDDNDPTPANYGSDPDSHGTSCAGEIAMVKDNNKCGVGVAYDSKIGGKKTKLNDWYIINFLMCKKIKYCTCSLHAHACMYTYVGCKFLVS